MFAVSESKVDNALSSTSVSTTHEAPALTNEGPAAAVELDLSESERSLEPLQVPARTGGRQVRPGEASREQSEFQRLLGFALKALARREHSSVELRRKLSAFSLGRMSAIESGSAGEAFDSVETAESAGSVNFPNPSEAYDSGPHSDRLTAGTSSSQTSSQTSSLASSAWSSGTDELISRVLAALSLDGSLSDERFAAEFVRSRIRKGYGPIRIRMELLERGVPDRLAEEHLTRPSDFWARQAAEVCLRKFGDPAAEDASASAGLAGMGDLEDASPEQIRDALKDRKRAAQQRWNRCARFLSQRGFPADLIYRTLDGRLLD